MTSTTAEDDIQVCQPLLEHGIKPTIQRIMDGDLNEKKGRKEEIIPEEDEDPLSHSLGHFGKWQFLFTFFLSLLNIPCTFHIFAPTFLSAMPDDFWCSRTNNFLHLPPNQWKNLTGAYSLTQEGETYDPCRIKAIDYESILTLKDLEAASIATSATRNCDEWEYDTSESGKTTVSEWDLVCKNKEWGNVSEMLFLFGVAIGGLTGSLSDKFGRKRMLIISLAMQTFLALMIAFVPWFSVYLVLRTLLGFFCVSLVFTGFVLCMELVGGKWLTISGVSYLMPVSLGYIFIAGIAYFVRGWRHLQLAITLPSIIMLSLSWLLPESPRWLIAMGNAEKAVKVVERAAKFNKKILPADTAAVIHKFCMRGEKEDKSEKSGGNISTLVGTWQLRKITLILCIMWFTNYFLYYGLVLNLSHLGGNVYINSVLSGGVELPAVAVSILILLKMGRKWPICLTLVLGGIACFVSSFFPSGSTKAISLAMVAKLSVSGTNVMLPVYTAELFPTLVRNLGIGVCNIASGASLLFIPYLWNMVWMGAGTPMCLLALGGILGGFLVLFLPETKQTLVDSIQQASSQS